MVAKRYHILHKLFTVNTVELNYEMTRQFVPLKSRKFVKKVSDHALQNQQILTIYKESVSNKFEMDPSSRM
jgi:hypothetical protein